MVAPRRLGGLTKMILVQGPSARTPGGTPHRVASPLQTVCTVKRELRGSTSPHAPRRASPSALPACSTRLVC